MRNIISWAVVFLGGDIHILNYLSTFSFIYINEILCDDYMTIFEVFYQITSINSNILSLNEFLYFQLFHRPKKKLCGLMADFFFFGISYVSIEVAHQISSKLTHNFLPKWIYICQFISTSFFSLQLFWAHILQAALILEAEQKQTFIPLIFLNNYIYPTKVMLKILNIWKILVIICSFFRGYT